LPGSFVNIEVIPSFMTLLPEREGGNPLNQRGDLGKGKNKSISSHKYLNIYTKFAN
jgi:hypothetical protein